MTSDEFAAFYNSYGSRFAEASAKSIFHKYLEKPAVRRLLCGQIADRLVLDIGCGTGVLSEWLATSGGIVTAIDCSQEMVAIASEQCAQLSRITFKCCPLAKFQPSISFDTVVASFMLGYFSSLPEFFEQAARILNQNGVLVASMLHPVRTKASARTKLGYVVDNYFDRCRYMSDFLGTDAIIPLYVWDFEDVVSAAVDNGFVLDALVEPHLSRQTAIEQDIDEFYCNAPSVAAFRFRRISEVGED